MFVVAKSVELENYIKSKYLCLTNTICNNYFNHYDVHYFNILRARVVSLTSILTMLLTIFSHLNLY